MIGKTCIVVAALLGAAAVTIGAYHAHGLEKMLTERGLDPAEVDKQLHNCDVAVKYQMYHGLALLGIGVLALRSSAKTLAMAAFTMVLGVAGFSGGLYAMVFNLADLHWAVVPIGGLLMIIGWVLVAIAGLMVSRDDWDF